MLTEIYTAQRIPLENINLGEIRTKEDPLGLLEAPITVRSELREEGKYFQAFIHRPFYGPELVSILNQVSPSLKAVSRSDIEDDWVIYDSKPGTPNYDLFEKHLASDDLREHFDFFGNHVDRFSRTLAMRNTEQIEDDLKRHITIVGKSYEEIKEEFLQSGMYGSLLEDFWGYMAEEQADREYPARMMKVMSAIELQAGNVITINRYKPEQGSPWHPSTFNREFVEKFLRSNPEVDMPLSIMMNTLFGGRNNYQIIKDSDGKDVAVSLGYPFKRCKNQEGVSSIDLEMNYPWSKKFPQKVEVTIQDGMLTGYNIEAFEQQALYPLIEWKRYGKRREVVVGGEAIVDGKTYNSLLGVITLPYFDPEISKKWPQKQGHPSLEGRQEMGAAQLPVFILTKQEDLPRANVLKDLEMWEEASRGI